MRFQTLFSKSGHGLSSHVGLNVPPGYLIDNAVITVTKTSYKGGLAAL